MTVTLHTGDCLEVLKTIPDKSVQCCVTSPPYFGLRQYIQEGAPEKPFEIGLEDTPEAYVEKLVAVFREVRRVLKDDGTLWLNLGDSFAGSGGAGGDYAEGGLKDGQPKWKSNFEIDKSKRNADKWGGGNIPSSGYLKPKDLIGIPWRVAFALQADGWWLRNDIIWAKPNPMPESVTDRCTRSHEYIFLLTKSAKYFYDAEAIKEVGSPETEARLQRGVSDHHKNVNGAPGQTPHSMNKPRPHASAYSFARKVNEEPGPGQPNRHREDREDIEYSGTRNKRDVWTVTTKPYKGAHFATYPPDLIEPCILAGTSAKGECPHCGKAWARVVEKSTHFEGGSGKAGTPPRKRMKTTTIRVFALCDIVNLFFNFDFLIHPKLKELVPFTNPSLVHP